MRAEVDIFSGRPNPSWELSPEQGVALRQRLDALPEAKEGATRDRLGYRGIIVTSLDDETVGFTRIAVSAGIVLEYGPGRTVRRRVDTGRTIERWLLETGRGQVDPEIYAAIERDIGH